jgi:O-antigen/teichoic acid export membrane protein
MSKAADMAKVSAKGGFHLLWGLVISTVISSVGTIFIARLLGSDLYGLYTVVLTVPTLIATFRDWGVNSAMIRCAAQYRAEGRTDEVRSVFVSGLIFEIALGLLLSVVCFALSGFLATTILNRPAIAPLIQIASFSILAGALVNAASAAFTGVEKMELNSVMLICQSIIKTMVIIALVVLGLGTLGATTGYTIAYLCAGVIGLLLMWTIYRTLPKPVNNKLQINAYIGSMLQYGIPLSISGIIGAFIAQFYTILLPVHYTTDNVIIGNYGVASTFVVLISFFSLPITTMLFPAFSKLDAQKDKQTLKNVFQFSVKYASLLVVPVAALIMCLSEPAISTLFGVTYSSAPLFLSLSAINYLYTAFGNLSTGNLINSQGHTTFNLYMTLLMAAIGIPMGYILIMNFGVIGLIATSLTAGLPGTFISLGWAKQRYGVTVDWMSSGKILFSSAIAAIVTYAIVTELGFASWIRLIIGVVLFLLILITAILLTRAITRSDIDNIRAMVSGLGPIGKTVNTFLNLIEKIMTAIKL